jgi:hypothetical protein
MTAGGSRIGTLAMHMGTGAGPAAHGSIGGIAMSAGHGIVQMAMGGMSLTAVRGGTNILPDWLSVIWSLVFIAVIVLHARHVVETHRERRLWHAGHVLMAVGMLFMYAPPSIDHLGIGAAFWQIVFANAAGAIVLAALAVTLNGVAVNRLWLVLAFDMAAMVYMWSPNGWVTPITWLLVAYFGLQALLWATNRYRMLDGHGLLGSRLDLNPDGTVTATAVAPLVCEGDLRYSMCLMALGMAYMFAAMQLLI